MPTKVIIQPPPSLTTLSNRQLRRRPEQGEDDQAPLAMRRSMSFKTSLLREIIAIPEEIQLPQRTLSSSDITGSPRLLGYFFNLLACLVMLVSVVQFNQNLRITTTDHEAIGDSNEQLNVSLKDSVADKFVVSFDAVVFKWKLIGTFVVSGFGVVLNLFIILAHFDKQFLPTLWTRIFRDGSRGERNMLVIILLLEVTALYINTSALSVGEREPNVFFTTWISFATTCLTYNIWRVSADKLPLDEIFPSHRRASQQRWVLLTFTTCVGCLALLDAYMNKDFYFIILKEVPTRLGEETWIRAFCIFYGSLLACFLALVGNNVFVKSFQMKLCRAYRLTLDWRQLEGILAGGVLGAFLYIIFIFTGVTGIKSQSTLGNGYFASWFSFLLSANGEFYTIFVLRQCIRSGTHSDLAMNCLSLWDLDSREQAFLNRFSD